MIAGVIAVIFWGLFPSLGPSALYDLPSEIFSTAPPVVGPDYGQEIARLYKEGVAFISPNEIRGLIAFPSFHIVLACAATYYARTLAWLFPIFIAVNLLVLPAVLVHGGHHAVDIPAGALIFALSAWLSQSLLPLRNKSVQNLAPEVI